MRACLCNANTSKGMRVEQDSALQNYPKVQALLHCFTHTAPPLTISPLQSQVGLALRAPAPRRGLKAADET